MNETRNEKFVVFSKEAIDGFSDEVLARQVRQAARFGAKRIHLVATDEEVWPLVDLLNNDERDEPICKIDMTYANGERSIFRKMPNGKWTHEVAADLEITGYDTAGVLRVLTGALGDMRSGSQS